jgi:hypothetical protein
MNTANTDLWGETIAPPPTDTSFPITRGADGHLEIPEWASAWWRSYLSTLDGFERDAAIDRGQADARKRERRRQNEHAKWAAGNPLIARFGAGPTGKTCATCTHLQAKDYHARRYYKCDLRGNSNGSGTDHRKKWLACGQYKGVSTHA